VLHQRVVNEGDVGTGCGIDSDHVLVPCCGLA
jgi:hypothetical protein